MHHQTQMIWPQRWHGAEPMKRSMMSPPFLWTRNIPLSQAWTVCSDTNFRRRTESALRSFQGDLSLPPSDIWTERQCLLSLLDFLIIGFLWQEETGIFLADQRLQFCCPPSPYFNREHLCRWGGMKEGGLCNVALHIWLSCKECYASSS